MKKAIYGLTAIALTAGTIITSCQSPAPNAPSTQQLNETKAVLPEEYPAFKKRTDSIIDANEKRMADIQVKMGEFPPDSFSVLKLDTLRAKNHELKDRLYGYEKVQSDWDSFKKKFQQDMDSLDTSLSNFWKRS